MEFVQIANDADVRVITMSRGKANAMNLPMMEELIEATNAAEADASIRGVVYASARPHFFSGGFDVEEVFNYDRPTMLHFFGRFMELFETILRMAKPVVGAIGGHAYAGGAFLALAFDVRVMADGEYGYAFNEINFGAILPPSIRRVLVGIVGTREAERMLITGDAVPPRRALETRLADEVVAPDQVLATAVKHARELGKKPERAFALTKRALQSDLGLPDRLEEHSSLDEFLEVWFSPECAERRKMLAASVKANAAKKE
jgi:Delta3-Delta2-enoyl-CoA isomerase